MFPCDLVCVLVDWSCEIRTMAALSGLKLWLRSCFPVTASKPTPVPRLLPNDHRRWPSGDICTARHRATWPRSPRLVPANYTSTRQIAPTQQAVRRWSPIFIQILYVRSCCTQLSTRRWTLALATKKHKFTRSFWQMTTN